MHRAGFVPQQDLERLGGVGTGQQGVGAGHGAVIEGIGRGLARADPVPVLHALTQPDADQIHAGQRAAGRGTHPLVEVQALVHPGPGIGVHPHRLGHGGPGMQPSAGGHRRRMDMDVQIERTGLDPGGGPGRQIDAAQPMVPQHAHLPQAGQRAQVQ